VKIAWKYWYIIVVLLAVGGGIWWRIRPKAVKYEEYIVSKGDIREELTVSGEVKAEKQADLKFQAGGRLAWVGVKQGDRVKKWQGVASLDRRSIEKNLQKELNDYMNERWNFEGDREIYHITTDDLDKYTLTPAARRVVEKAQFDLNNTVLDVEIQAVAKEFASITAPFEGLISDLKFPDPGINVSGTDVIAVIVDPATVYFEAEVDEVEIGKIFAGQEAEVVFDAYPEETVVSRVSEVGFSPVTLSGGGKGYRVKLWLPGGNRDLKYKLGMSGDARLVVAEKTGVLTLPAAAVSEKEGKKLVKQKQGKQVAEKEITVGLETEERVEILAGAGEGEKVVVEIRAN